MRNIYFIFGIGILAVAVFGSGFYFYQRDQLAKQINDGNQNQINYNNQNFWGTSTSFSNRYDIPSTSNKTSILYSNANFATSSTATSTKKTSTGLTLVFQILDDTKKTGFSSSTKTMVVSDYIDSYKEVVKFFQKNTEDLKLIQTMLSQLNSEYQKSGTANLDSILENGKNLNQLLQNDNTNFKKYLDNWDTANKKTINLILEQKTDGIILAGRDFASSIDYFSNSLNKILDFRGVGNINALTADLQAAGQKTNLTSSKFVSLINELVKTIKK